MQKILYQGLGLKVFLEAMNCIEFAMDVDAFSVDAFEIMSRFFVAVRIKYTELKLYVIKCRGVYINSTWVKVLLEKIQCSEFVVNVYYFAVDAVAIMSRILVVFRIKYT